MTGNPETAAGRLVLVADDNPVIQLGFGEVLKRLGFSVKVVSDGRAVLDALEGGGYAVAFLDLNMPVMNGLDCIGEIRRREEDAGGDRLPVVVITGEDATAVRTECIAAGADGVLIKPFTLEELSGVLGRVLTGGGSFPSRPSASEETRETASGRTLSEPGSLNAARIAEIRGLEASGSPALLRKMTELFRRNSEGLLQDIGRALGKGDAEAVSLAAHELKGSSGSIGGERLRTLCADMELLGRRGILGGAEGLLSLIRTERQALLDELSELISAERG